MNAQPTSTLNSNSLQRATGSAPNDIARGYQRLLYTVFFGTARRGQSLKQRRPVSIPLLGLAIFVSLANFACEAATAPITWGMAQTISGDSDVSTIGTFFAAANNGGTGVQPTTVNGVLFNPFVTNGTNTMFTSGNLTLSSPAPISGGSSFGGAAPFSNLSAAYQTLLASASDARSLKLSVSGLTIGQSYFVELWANFSGLSSPVQEIVSAGNSTTSVFNTTSTPGGVGQFVTGTFTSNAPTESITLNITGSSAYHHAILNAVEVRALAVPEPSVWAMMGAGSACLLATMHFRRRRI